MNLSLILLLAVAAPATPPTDTPARLLGATLSDGQAVARLADLTDTIGPAADRLAGSRRGGGVGAARLQGRRA